MIPLYGALKHKYPNRNQITVKIDEGVESIVAWDVPDVPEPPPESEWNTIKEEYNTYLKSTKYQRDRAVAFDPIPEQLDQIYHDIDGWKARIKSVKDKYPKPT
jgi:hypothetical protein